MIRKISKFFNFKEFNSLNKPKEFKKGDTIFLRKPNKVSKLFYDDFSDIFNRYPNIIKAYLAEGFLEIGEESHFIVGLVIVDIEMVQLMKLISQEVSQVCKKVYYVDFISIGEGEISSFMKKNLTPFYSRKLF